VLVSRPANALEALTIEALTSAWYAASVCSTGRTHAAAVAVRSGRCGVCHILWISLLEHDSQATHRTCQRKRYTQAPSLPQSIEVSECGAPGCGHSMTAPHARGSCACSHPWRFGAWGALFRGHFLQALTAAVRPLRSRHGHLSCCSKASMACLSNSAILRHSRVSPTDERRAARCCPPRSIGGMAVPRAFPLFGAILHHHLAPRLRGLLECVPMG
jgi:hypothetical protein